MQLAGTLQNSFFNGKLAVNLWQICSKQNSLLQMFSRRLQLFTLTQKHLNAFLLRNLNQMCPFECILWISLKVFHF